MDKQQEQDLDMAETTYRSRILPGYILANWADYSPGHDVPNPEASEVLTWTDPSTGEERSATIPTVLGPEHSVAVMSDGRWKPADHLTDEHYAYLKGIGNRHGFIPAPHYRYSVTGDGSLSASAPVWHNGKHNVVKGANADGLGMKAARELRKVRGETVKRGHPVGKGTASISTQEAPTLTGEALQAFIAERKAKVAARKATHAHEANVKVSKPGK